MKTAIAITKILFLAILLSGCGNKPSNEAGSGINDTVVASEKLKPAVSKTIVFFGNSLTAGYGLDPSEAFPALIQKKIDSMNLSYKVVNAGVSGETTSGGVGRIGWILRQPVDVFVLELGGNDGLRGIPLTETRKNLQIIIDSVSAKYPDVRIMLAGMQIPPNMGQRYAREFRDLYPELAKKNNITLIPFLLEGVGGETRFNQQDGIHPTVEGHAIVAENVWKHLKDLL